MVVPEIDVDELARRRGAGASLVDVRRADEYDEFHVPGAQLITLDELPARLDELPSDRPLLLICRSGARSLKAAEWLIANGVESVNVAGGSLAWLDAGHPVVQGPDPG